MSIWRPDQPYNELLVSLTLTHVKQAASRYLKQLADTGILEKRLSANLYLNSPSIPKDFNPHRITCINHFII